MKNFLVGVAAVVGILAVSAAPAQAALSLTLSDGNPLHEQIVTDGGSPGTVVFSGGTVGNWSIDVMVGVFLKNQPVSTLDLAYGVRATPGNSSILTVTLTQTGYRPPGSSIDDILLALGGVGGANSITQTAFINGLAVGSSGTLGGLSYNADAIPTIHLHGDEFILSQQLVLTGTGHNGGDSDFSITTTVPEPGTALAGIFAGACGLGVIVARTFRARRR